MLKLHKYQLKAKPPHEQESLQRQIAATDKAIDAVVNGEYGNHILNRNRSQA